MSKVKYGLKNVHYAVVTETTDGVTGEVTSTYGTVKALPGAVSLTMDPQGEDSPFYADDSVYYTVVNNAGYSGNIEIALIPEDIQVEVLGQTKDSNDVVVESNNDAKKYIALMGEFTEDEGARRFLFYRCTLARPSVSGSTKGENIEVQTETVTITATPRPDDGKIKALVGKSSDAYATWYSAVYEGSSSSTSSEP